MTDRPRLFDDLAGVAGGAISALTGMREEINALVRSRVDEVLGQLQVVRREEFEVVRELAANARMAGEDADQRIAALEKRMDELEKRSVHTPDTHTAPGNAVGSGYSDQPSGWSGDNDANPN
ncbi:accessory factor UbiK family protein [Acetobacter fallax]|uniref:Accessory factor UbiK family protein n=1 Tax=Acetobacter fallax TaxID=1737473 RepID=A0ABX0K5N6_9PROT|nr:accessory factor UbiK family protein [Acetobacter fallax]NHO31609.1 accessory factor UbiK family protein [Acetobacter fallax]NHO35168.1 accessory factor UbiK family protein [Acetobacter fallax]